MQLLLTCILNCSLERNKIGPGGGVALGEALTPNKTLQILRYMYLRLYFTGGLPHSHAAIIILAGSHSHAAIIQQYIECHSHHNSCVSKLQY